MPPKGRRKTNSTHNPPPDKKQRTDEPEGVQHTHEYTNTPHTTQPDVSDQSESLAQKAEKTSPELIETNDASGCARSPQENHSSTSEVQDQQPKSPERAATNESESTHMEPTSIESEVALLVVFLSRALRCIRIAHVCPYVLLSVLQLSPRYPSQLSLSWTPLFLTGHTN